jgi:hypothetical protein
MSNIVHRSAFVFALIGSSVTVGAPPAAAQFRGASSTNVAQNNQWRARLMTDRSQYSGPRAVVISMILTNVSQRRQLVSGIGRPYDVVIRDARTMRPVWTSAKSRPAPASSIDLAPGASQTYREIWDRTSDTGSAVPAGVYTVETRIGPMPSVSTQVYVAQSQGRDGGGDDIERPIPIEPGGGPPPPAGGGGKGQPEGPVSALQGTLRTESPRVAPGGQVRLTYQVTNPTGSPLIVRFSSGQRYDLVVSAVASGADVWRASMERMYTMSLGGMTLAAGETRNFTDTWNVAPGTAPGRYRITAYLTPMRMTRQPNGGPRPTAATATTTVEVTGT